MSGRYPSKKMGVTIQTESGKVEGPAVLMLENDDDVLEYYDQPNKITINYINDFGTKRGTLYTPDFFVIRKFSAGWEEWKQEENLEEITKKQTWKYNKDEVGQWKCPPGEEFARAYGLTFNVRTSNEINWNLTRNYVFLDDYLRRKEELVVARENLESIKKVIFREPGISLKQLIEYSIEGKFDTDDIIISIIKEDIFVKLDEVPLAEPGLVHVFLHKEHAAMYENLINCKTDLLSGSYISLEVGVKVLWDSNIWTIINAGNEMISLTSDGKYNEIPRELFLKLINEGKIVSETQEVKDNDPIIDFITGASEEDYKDANLKYQHVKNYLENGSKNYDAKSKPKLRTVRDWVSKYRESQKLYGNGYVGLLPNDKKKRQ